MRVLSHRGYWREAREKNSSEAFARSFELGFGTETDLRDLGGALVVSHDPPTAGAMDANRLFGIHAEADRSLPLALNIKADGLQPLVAACLERHGPTDAFVFDMSIPDTLRWLHAGVPVFVRHSDVEPEPALYGEAQGVWLDAFHSDWWTDETIARHLERDKRVCVVSPELHGREHRAVWDRLAAADFVEDHRLMLCTDFPEDARSRLAPHNG